MKRSLAIVALLVLLVFTGSLVAAQTAGTSQPGSESLYIKTMYISKIYPHNLGYKVIYWTGDGKVAVTYIPLSWFTGTAGKAEILAEYSRAVPYMEIVFSSGKFKFVRLHVSPSFNDPSWGSLIGTEDISGMFKADSLDLQY